MYLKAETGEAGDVEQEDDHVIEED
jgi:hypothetical protein